MEEFEINLVGNDEEIKNEEIFNDFDFNYVPINNLPISYFPLNNGLLFNELKKVNNEYLTGGEELGNPEFSSDKLTIDASNSPYTILVKKNIDCELNLSGTSKKIRLNKGIYTIIFDFNGYNIIQKKNIDLYKELNGSSTNITLNFLNNNSSNVNKISSNKKKIIDINASTGVSIETTTDNPNYKLLVYRNSGNSNKLKLNKDITGEVLIVGGGGSGALNCVGWEGGGGGGGGAVGMGTITFKKDETYTITIGAGGGSIKSNSDGANGGDTSINGTGINEIAYGGGYGSLGQGGQGGSGGGSSGSGGNRPEGNAKKSSGKLTYYGNNGGYGYNQAGGSGGGGAGSKGNSPLKYQDYNGGIGGDGIVSLITGTRTYYGGGGGGSANAFKTGITHGKGGKGGGGDGEYYNKATDGSVNTGGGGGGANGKKEDIHESSVCNENSKSGAGGSGIVIIRIRKEDVDDDLDNNELLTTTDTRIINEINNVLDKKMIEFNNDEKPYNYLGILPLIILIIIIWIFIFLFLLKFVHHYFASIYLYILLFIIIFLLIFGSLWFLYTNNDIL